MNETIKDKINDYIKEKPKEQELYEIVNKLLYNEDALKDYILDTQNKIKKLEKNNKKLKEENEHLQYIEEQNRQTEFNYSKLERKYETFKNRLAKIVGYDEVYKIEDECGRWF